MKKVGLLTAAIVVAVFFFLLATLPPLPARLNVGIDPDLMRRTIRGAYHIHSTRSDGAGDKDGIAEAAARAGLSFIILTDHGDGTRTPDPPAYLHGVLCLDAVEISTTGGHYVALDMRPSPYPLGGEPTAVVEDVKRLGGFAIVAHPDSPRSQLAWTDWDAPFDGIEWLSADSEWRDESRLRLSRAFFDYFLRPAPALASLLDRPVTTLRHWDELTTRRPVVALAGLDAHGGIGRGIEEGGKRRAPLGHIPSYEASFRTFTTRAVLDRPLTGDAVWDSRALMEAIRRGNVFTVVDAIASPGFINVKSSDPLFAFVHVAMPDGGKLVVMQGGRDLGPLAVGSEGKYTFRTDPGSRATRFEVRVPGSPGTPPVPWLVTNPIYRFAPASGSARTPNAELSIPVNESASWHVEKDPESTATIHTSGGEVRLDYRLASGARRTQFAAAVTDIQDRPVNFSALEFSAVAAAPVRISVQL